MNTVGAPLAGYKLTGSSRTGPPDAITAIEVWGRHDHRDAIVRIISDATSENPKPMNAGTVTAGGTDNILLVWTAEARLEFGTAWLDQQEAETKRLLANRWGGS